MQVHFLTAACLAAAMFGHPAFADGYATVKPETAAAFLSSHRGPVLDVRVVGDCDMERSLSRPTVKIPFDAETEGDHAKMSREAFISEVSKQWRLHAAKRAGHRVLVVCCKGVRSAQVATLLEVNGFRAAHLAGGLMDAEFPNSLLKEKRNAD
jgi:rhodanese-related sulfurtransferase